MKLTFVHVYLGPWPGAHGLVCDFLPRITLGDFADGGYISVGWFFWSVELQWKSGESR